MYLYYIAQNIIFSNFVKKNLSISDVKFDKSEINTVKPLNNDYQN